ncbi:MAG: hypothetical protein JWR26_1719 [Pedosphaera sp.]|nr:hypothetical protein [Pedosphaera sp.]
MKRFNAFTRPAGLVLLIGLSVMSAYGIATDGKIPPLHPPHDALQSSYWEQHRWPILITAGGAVLALAALSTVLLMRSKSVVVTPPVALARRALESLRGRQEDGQVLMEVSRIVRRYINFAFGFPPAELTTAETQQALQSHSKINPELAAGITDFLHRCDISKFAPGPPAGQIGAVARALELVEKVEKHTQEPAA